MGYLTAALAANESPYPAAKKALTLLQKATTSLQVCFCLVSDVMQTVLYLLLVL